QEQEKPTKEGFFARLKRSLLKTKENLGSGFISLFRGKKIDDDRCGEWNTKVCRRGGGGHGGGGTLKGEPFGNVLWGGGLGGDSGWGGAQTGWAGLVVILA
ncbi:hypothetical protein KCA24_24530, partial [Escherichia coli]|nr:hypothetical protein [Escherichia coli]